MLLKHFIVGLIETNCYLVSSEETKETIIIDPGFDENGSKEILDEIKKGGLKVRFIINTHGHTDHTSGNGILKKATGGEILIHPDDASLLAEPWAGFSEMLKHHKVTPCPACGAQSARLTISKDKRKATLSCNSCGFSFELVASPSADKFLNDTDIIKIDNIEFLIIHTPGHSKGGISLYCKREKIVFTGDTLFAGSIGRTDLPGASFEDIMLSIKNKLMKLPDDTIVYPGHGEKTTIGKEKQVNPYLLSIKNNNQ